MNRLQVGDECYVREVATKKIFKGIFGHSYDGERNGWIKVAESFVDRDGDQLLSCKIKASESFRLVYPFPCVKELAQ